MNKEVIFLRHATRDPIPEGEVGNDVLLNSFGERESYQYGQQLTRKIAAFMSSPIERCVQTAKKIAEGAGATKATISETTALGDPGIFISDGAVAWKSWQKHGGQRVKEHFLSGEVQWPGFANFNIGARELARMLHHQITELNEGEAAIWVTHDTVLATFISRLAPKPLSLSEWPAFLAGVHVKESSHNRLEMRYGGLSWEVSI